MCISYNPFVIYWKEAMDVLTEMDQACVYTYIYIYIYIYTYYYHHHHHHHHYHYYYYYHRSSGTHCVPAPKT